MDLIPCPECGISIAGDVTMCPYCGAPLVEREEDSEDLPEPIGRTHVPTQPVKPR